MGAATDRHTVDFWLDPSCPLTWVSACWLTMVADHRPVVVRWRVMSLTLLNEGKEVDPEGDPEGYLKIPARVAAAVQTEHGHDALGRFHRALWTRPDGTTDDWIGDLADALDRAGLPRELARAGLGTDYDAALRASHDDAVSRVAAEVGTPIISITGPGGTGSARAIFGPVFSAVPATPDAVRVWDAVAELAAVGEFRELKR